MLGSLGAAQRGYSRQSQPADIRLQEGGRAYPCTEPWLDLTEMPVGNSIRNCERLVPSPEDSELA